MSTRKSFVWNTKNISLGIVGLFLLMAFAGINFFPDTEGSEAAVSAPIASVTRLEGEINFDDGDLADQIFEGTKQYDRMGSAVAVGDINGDGNDDYILGSYGANSYSGEVNIFFGMINAHPYNDNTNANITITGPGGSAYMYTVAVGDFNGDDIDDVLMGAYYYNRAGSAWILFGKRSWPKQTSLSTSKLDVEFKGTGSLYSSGYAQLGKQVQAGDLDGDGYDEVIAFAPYYAKKTSGHYCGGVFIWWGRSSWAKSYECSKDEYDTFIYGKQSSYSYQYGYMGMYGNQKPADLNGDGADELFFGGSYEYYYPSSTSSYSGGQAGAVHILAGTPGSRSRWPKDTSIYDIALGQGGSTQPEHHWLYSSSSGQYFGQYARGADMDNDGDMDLVVSKGTSSGTTYIFWGDGTLDNFGGGTFSTRLRYNSHPDYTTISGPTSIHVDDFDGDFNYDLIGGTYYQNSPNGALWLWYGGDRDDWGDSKSKSDANYTINGGYYDYLGYYAYGPNIDSGDFNNDDVPDLFFGAFNHRSIKTGASYVGAGYVLLTAPSEMNLNSFELLDGDGENNDIFCVEAGGNGYEPTNDQVGDGIYTFKVAYNDTWTVGEVMDIRIQFRLKGQYQGMTYDFAYSPANETFYIVEDYGGGIIIHPDRSEFRMLSFNDAEVYLAVSFTTEFLTQEPFDVIATANTARTEEQVIREDWLHVEMDLTFDKDDIKVLREEQEVFRGDFLAGGPPLVVTGTRVVFFGTDVSPTNDKFFLRIIDTYGRNFENRSSAGYDIYFELPTNVDSGKYRFNLNLIIDGTLQHKMEDLSIIPEFYVALDFIGPDAPPNLAFHADSQVDPEGRWDNDPIIWGTWDPSFDSQVGIDHYEYMIEGPDGFFEVNSTSELSVELELGGDGVYYIYVWAVDKVGNHGVRGMKTVIIDSAEIMLSGAKPSYLGGQWFNSKDVDIIVKVTDTVLNENGPHLKMSTLQFALTEGMTKSARDDENTVWKRPIYNVIKEEIIESNYVYTLSVKIPNLKEGKDNFVWFKIMDEAGNEGITALVDSADPGYEENSTKYNPSNIWIDITALTYTDPTPTAEEVLEENIVPVSVVINDLGSGVDASSIQYAVSRNGLTNYGGWISANINEDGNTILAETVTPLLFQPGSDNYVRWRAKDLAGNGYTFSEDFVIRTMVRPVNNPPIAEINEPVMQAVFNTRETITFDATDSSDPDLDTLSFRWVLANKQQISEQGTFEMDASLMERGIHVITLYVSDGDFTVTDSISIYIKQHPDEVDTDNDGLADGADTDDDNDGLLDVEEADKGTNPRLKDSDQDGVYDSMDEQPLNPEVGLPDEREGEYSYWDILILILILAVFLILIGSMVVFKRRSTMEKDRVMRNVTQEGRIVQRYEVLTGVEAPLLPQVKEMGVTLPPVAAQQVVPIKRAQALTETPTLPPTAEAPAPEPAQTPEPAPAPEPAPEPTPIRRERSTATPGATPGAVPTPEELTSTAALPGEANQPAAQTTNCDLCGSSIDVPAGATAVECPLCGEKKAL